jgi:hypothetical protein
MTRAFIVTLQVDPYDDMSAHADDILDSLQTDGLPVIKVVPYVDDSQAASPISTMQSISNSPLSIG